jgi:hypothetical protein
MKFCGSLFLLISSVSVWSQTVTDEDRRGFDNLAAIYIDIDGDGRPDRIQPRTYKTYHWRSGQRLAERNIRRWITFDLTLKRGRAMRSFFTYNYGTGEVGGSYWVYALIPDKDRNGDGMLDLVFYAGDDTTEETIRLESRRTRYVVRDRKLVGPEDL